MMLSRLSSRVLLLCPGSAEFRPGDHEAAARIAEARVAIQYHAAETALFAEAALLQFCGNAGPLLRDIEENRPVDARQRSEEHTSELQSLMRISYAVFCLKKKNNNNNDRTNTET